MGKSLVDTRKFVISSLEEKIGRLNSRFLDLQDQRESSERAAALARSAMQGHEESAKISQSKMNEIQAEIDDFNEELKRQQGAVQ